MKLSFSAPCLTHIIACALVTGVGLPLAVAQETPPLPPAEVAPAVAAQQDVSKARKLIKLQKFQEAIPLLEGAFLVLDDPEIIRMLGEAHEGAGLSDKASTFYETYLADPTVGESAKAPVRRRKAALEGGSGAPEDGPVGDEYGISDWTFSGLAGGVPGRGYVTFYGGFSHLRGADYTAPMGGDGPDANDTVEGTWVHGGAGLGVEMGGYLTERISLGLFLGGDWASWQVRGPEERFGTTILRGARPELGGVTRIFFGGGFYGGFRLGADIPILLEAQEDPMDCSVTDTCVPLPLETGALGFRLLGGGELGYRSHVSDELLVGLGVNVDWLPVFLVQNEAVEAMPGFTDAGLTIGVKAGLTWNL